MRYVALLLLGLAVGFLSGRASVPDREERTEPRASPAAPEPPAPAASRPETPPMPTVIRPAETVDGDQKPRDGRGELWIDFAGFDGEWGAYVGVRTITGGYDTEPRAPVDEGDTTVLFVLEPGVYDVWWQARDGRRGVLAAVESGKATHLRAAEIRTAAPIPEGLGALDVEVEALSGGGLPRDVTVRGPRGTTEVETNGFGRGSAILAPGRYVLEIGDHREEVQVAIGRATAGRLVRAAEGDLVIDGADAGNSRLEGVTLERAGKRLESRGCLFDGVYRFGFVFIQEGEYDVVVRGVPIGHAVIRAGQVTRVECALPPGGLELYVIVPSWALPEVSVAPSGGAPMRLRVQQIEGRLSVFEAPLVPGRYSITASARGCESKSAEIEVTDHEVQLVMELVEEK